MNYKLAAPDQFLSSSNLRAVGLFSTALLITVSAFLITSQSISPHALPPALGRAKGSKASPWNSHRPACVSKGKEMTQAGKKSKSRKRHNSSWACNSLQPGPHTALSLPRPRARGPARSGRSGLSRRARALDPAAASSGCACCAARKEAAEWVPPARTAPAGRGSQNPRPDRGAASQRAGSSGPQPRPGGLSMPVRRRPRVLLPLARGGATRSSAGTGRGGGDTHPWWRWRQRRWRLGPKCHLRSRGCMPGARAAGTAAGLAPRRGRGLRSGPPPPPQAPAPGPPAAGLCGMGRVARYIPGAPLARPSPAPKAPLGPPARQSLSPAVVPSGHRSPPQERSEKQTAGRAARPFARHSSQGPPIQGMC